MTDAEKIAAITRYRDAYFAYHANDMQRNLEYERLRAVHPWSSVSGNDAFGAAWDAYSLPLDDERARLQTEVGEALWALTVSPPPDFVALQALIDEAFGE